MAYRDLNAMPGRKERLHPQHCTCTACTASADPMPLRSGTILRLQVATAALVVALMSALPALFGVQM